MSELVNGLLKQLQQLSAPPPAVEYRFAAEAVGFGPGVRERLDRARLRDWRFDLAWPEIRFAVEVEGGGWVGGRHTRGAGFSEDLRKYHSAMRLGWTVYRCDGRLVKTGDAALLIRDLIGRLKKDVDTPAQV